MNSRTYDQYCPIARSLDLLGERWTLLLVRELLTGPRRFSDLRTALPGLSPNLLTTRLRALEAAGLVRRRELPPPAARLVYELTDRGRALEPVLFELARWGLPFLDLPDDEGPAPHLVPSGIKAMVRIERVGDEPMAALLDLDLGRFRLGVEGPGGRAVERVTVRAATADDGPADVTVRGPLVLLLWVRQGVLDWSDAEAEGLVVDGPAAARARFCALFEPEEVPTLRPA
jgi:DNA-binding HxlR family transcriptional regulator